MIEKLTIYILYGGFEIHGVTIHSANDPPSSWFHAYNEVIHLGKRENYQIKATILTQQTQYVFLVTVVTCFKMVCIYKIYIIAKQGPDTDPFSPVAVTFMMKYLFGERTDFGCVCWFELNLCRTSISVYGFFCFRASREICKVTYR